ncbi:MAG: alpha/beta hydrolase-fold protein, partial [Gemmatimonadaceae bacterium]|nr:alpha/beta hydrolase-fold protein [Gemmatimonadaceae bacterium]
MLRRLPLLLALGVTAILSARATPAQAPPPPDAVADRQLERLVGTWHLVGTVRGDSVAYYGTGRRILADRFVELHLLDRAVPAAYEARIAIGADTARRRVLAHWLDSYGAAFSVPAGSGAVSGDTLQFTLAYTDGPFRDTFVFGRDGGWTLHIESRDARGRWQTFARYTARREMAVAAGIPVVAGSARPVATLEVLDVTTGTGALVQPGQCIAAHYSGWLVDGTRFSTTRDSTADGRPRPPLVFPQGVRRVIAGWDAGFEGMRVGGTRRLRIPYQFAYGERGRPPAIPPRAMLTFDVELVGVADTLPQRDAYGRYPGCAPWGADAGAASGAWREVTGPGIVGRVLRRRDWAGEGLKPRHVDVWLPPGYDANPAARYPVVYLHDGQNLFDPASSYGGQEWGFDEVVTAMVQDGRLRPAIYVGLWNTADRWREYLPQAPVQGLRSIGTGIGGRVDVTEPWLGDAYLRFLTGTVKPEIDRAFRTRPEAAQTFVMGSSMGGLASLYAISRAPEVFGAAAAISTHWPAADGATIPWFASHLPDRRTHRLWMDHGTAMLDSLYPPLQARMDSAMRAAGWQRGASWVSRAYPGAAHDERSWRARLHEPLAFLLGPALPSLAGADSALVGRILVAEDRRDADDPAIGEGLRHPDVRVQRLARRARGRITDPAFAARDSLPLAAPAPWWPEPSWRLRYRALRPPKGDCAPLRAAMTDSSWAVRLRAIDLADSTCASDDALVAMLVAHVEALPAEASRRATGGI